MMEPREEQARNPNPVVSDDDAWADEEDGLEAAREVQNDCWCGECCKLIIETDLEDAKREPTIAERGSPI